MSQKQRIAVAAALLLFFLGVVFVLKMEKREDRKEEKSTEQSKTEMTWEEYFASEKGDMELGEGED